MNFLTAVDRTTSCPASYDNNVLRAGQEAERFFPLATTLTEAQKVSSSEGLQAVWTSLRDSLGPMTKASSSEEDHPYQEWNGPVE